MADLLGNRIVKANIGSMVFLSHSYRGTMSIPHGSYKYLVRLYLICRKSHKSGAWRVGE